MFFFKKNDDEPKRFVAVTGTSPLALFLAYILQQNNVEVVVLDKLKRNKTDKTESWLFKSNFQNQGFSIKFCNELNKKPEYCFLASSFDEYRNDLLALSDDFLKGVKVVNFASFYNHELIEQMENVDEIRAYFTGWLMKSKKEITMLNRNAEIKICSMENIEKDLQAILNDNKLEVKFGKDSKKTFWQKMSAWFLGNLLVLAYENDVSKIMLNNELRQNTDAVMKDISQILKTKEVQIDTQTLLTDVYAFPDGFVSEYASLRGLNSLSEMIEIPDYFNHPKLFEMIKKAFKKY